MGCYRIVLLGDVQYQTKASEISLEFTHGANQRG